MDISIHKVSGVIVSKVRKQDDRETWVMNIKIVSFDYSRTDAKMVEVRNTITLFTNEGPKAVNPRKAK